ncbi:bifunctional DnaQ family exonuclease/ATP-dependent helicase [Streptococcus caballi]|uniref:bifunctional DnaQ family exonuclease/ATP-dependent helicase n=1 Tax=Streptococcus caballi TaxID=439220 RepID=UPI0003778DF8|nr:bifunctional DnaQ family exonuclease/ATP-dependent helicase [Streptococcus caballi]
MTKDFSRRYAVVDLEATGANHTASIIQVGIVILEDGKIVQTYETDVNPHEALNEHIIKLTGITDEQLAQAPDFSQVAREIYELIEDCVFVAHNVKFDANLLAEHLFLEGYELRTPRVDTVELAQVFYPTLEKYTLGNLANYLGLDLSHAHTAIDDAKATAQLFFKIKEKMASLPKLVLENILNLADNLLFESRMVIEEAFEKAQSSLPDCYLEVAGLVLRKEEAMSPRRKLSADFDVNLALLGLDARAKQQLFADLVSDAFDKPQISFLEAQAGLGKTYGYLLPLLYLAQEQVIVSVPTKILQDQIMANEVKKIKEIFHISCHSIKGPQNYIKLDDFYASLHHVGDNRLVNRYKMQILVWLLETETGDLDEIKQKQRFQAYFDQIKHDGNLSSKSLFGEQDFWHRSYAKSQASQLLLVNHAYFLDRVQDDKAFAAKKVLVFDEAQKLLLNLEQFSRRQLNVTKLLQQMTKDLQESSSLLEKRLLESLSFDLSHLVSRFYKSRRANLSTEDLQAIRQSSLELSSGGYETLKEMFLGHFDDFWLETAIENEKRVTYLNASSNAFLNFKKFLPETRKTYMVSATLQISSQVSLADLMGFDDFDFSSIKKDRNQSQTVFIDKQMPDLSQLSEETYAQEIAQRLISLKQLDQPVLVLFNAKKTMLDVSDLLDRADLNHLTQDKNGTAYNIKRRFENGESQFLLGTGAFWEGVDFVQADRMVEVITRLPFENPKDAFVKKINSYLTSQGKSPFYDYSLPLTILKLKQAIGRTMRRENQRSAVLILDSRIINKRYGKTIYQSLEAEFDLSSQKFTNCLTEIRNFLI